MSNGTLGKPSLITLFPGARINLNVTIGGGCKNTQPKPAPKPIGKPSTPQPKRITAAPAAKPSVAAKAPISKAGTAPKPKASTPAPRSAGGGAVRRGGK